METSCCLFFQILLIFLGYAGVSEPACPRFLCVQCSFPPWRSGYGLRITRDRWWVYFILLLFSLRKGFEPSLRSDSLQGSGRNQFLCGRDSGKCFLLILLGFKICIIFYFQRNQQCTHWLIDWLIDSINQYTHWKEICTIFTISL